MNAKRKVVFNDLDTGEPVLDAALHRIVDLEVAREALRAALKHYGSHDDGCSHRMHQDCSCGLYDALGEP